MPDQFSRDKVYIISNTARKYDILQTQNSVIIKKRPTPSVFPTYVKPRPISHTKKKVEKKVPEPIKIVADVPKKKVEVSTPNDVSLVSPISNSMSFAELQKKVDAMRAKEQSKKPVEIVDTQDEEVPVVTMEDANDLADGVISEEQELINKKYLKSLETSILKKVYYVATGKKPNKDTSKFEMRTEIIAKYKEANAKRKQVIYESSKG